MSGPRLRALSNNRFQRFQDLTINRSFPAAAVKRRPASKVAKKPVRMEVDDEEEDDESDTYSEDDESRHTPSPPPPPPPRARPVVKKVAKKQPPPPSVAVPPKTNKKSAPMVMNRVRLASLPDNVSTKEVTVRF